MRETQPQVSSFVCQSCSMPMEKPTDFGTEIDGLASKEFCVFCYSNGSFIEPDLILSQMIDKVSRMLAKQMNISEDEASSIARTSVPSLKRWQKKI
ncbi:MAG: zinc ribbon domain-containing protein [Candidatus Wolfebacteria bacterium]|nr:zinc ribbon domain-containing protein [Candidatus Wolfebacteria bacterium]